MSDGRGFWIVYSNSFLMLIVSYLLYLSYKAEGKSWIYIILPILLSVWVIRRLLKKRSKVVPK